MTQQFFNNFDTTLSVQAEIVDTTITVNDATGLPVTLGGGNNYRLTLSDGPVETLWEIVDVVVDRAGNVITVVRAQEGTSALVWPIGTFVSARNTAETMDGAVGGGGGGGSGAEIITGRQIGMIANADDNTGVLGYTRDGGDSWNGDRLEAHLGLAGGDVDGPRFVPGSGKNGSYLCTLGTAFI